MAFRAKTGGGSRKGSPNKFNKTAKESFQRCFIAIGGDKEFAEWAKLNRTEFYKLYSRLIPIDVQSGGKDIFQGFTVEIINGKDSDKGE